MTQRSCNGCTACCEGWLEGSAYNHKFFSGRPCHFKGKDGCSIYENRPKEQCQDFNCMWLTNLNIPEWLKPNLSKVIIVEKNNKDIGYYIEVSEMGKKIDSVVLSWLFQFHQNNRINMSIQIDSGWMHYGTKEYLEYKGMKI